MNLRVMSTAGSVARPPTPAGEEPDFVEVYKEFWHWMRATYPEATAHDSQWSRTSGQYMDEFRAHLARQDRALLSRIEELMPKTTWELLAATWCSHDLGDGFQ